MSNAASSALKLFLGSVPICPVCRNQFDSKKRVPYVLPCGHSMCEVCIRNYYSHFKTNEVLCPCCRDPTRTKCFLSGCGCVGYPKNGGLSLLMDKVHEVKKFLKVFNNGNVEPSEYISKIALNVLFDATPLCSNCQSTFDTDMHAPINIACGHDVCKTCMERSFSINRFPVLCCTICTCTFYCYGMKNNSQYEKNFDLAHIATALEQAKYIFYGFKKEPLTEANAGFPRREPKRLHPLKMKEVIMDMFPGPYGLQVFYYWCHNWIICT